MDLEKQFTNFSETVVLEGLGGFEQAYEWATVLFVFGDEVLVWNYDHTFDWFDVDEETYHEFITYGRKDSDLAKMLGADSAWVMDL